MMTSDDDYDDLYSDEFESPPLKPTTEVYEDRNEGLSEDDEVAAVMTNKQQVQVDDASDLDDEEIMMQLRRDLQKMEADGSIRRQSSLSDFSCLEDTHNPVKKTRDAPTRPGTASRSGRKEPSADPLLHTTTTASYEDDFEPATEVKSYVESSKKKPKSKSKKKAKEEFPTYDDENFNSRPGTSKGKSKKRTSRVQSQACGEADEDFERPTTSKGKHNRQSQDDDLIASRPSTSKGISNRKKSSPKYSTDTPTSASKHDDNSDVEHEIITKKHSTSKKKHSKKVLETYSDDEFENPNKSKPPVEDVSRPSTSKGKQNKKRNSTRETYSDEELDRPTTSKGTSSKRKSSPTYSEEELRPKSSMRKSSDPTYSDEEFDRPTTSKGSSSRKKKNNSPTYSEEEVKPSLKSSNGKNIDITADEEFDRPTTSKGSSSKKKKNSTPTYSEEEVKLSTKSSKKSEDPTYSGEEFDRPTTSKGSSSKKKKNNSPTYSEEEVKPSSMSDGKKSTADTEEEFDRPTTSKGNSSKKLIRNSSPTYSEEEVRQSTSMEHLEKKKSISEDPSPDEVRPTSSKGNLTKKSSNSKIETNSEDQKGLSSRASSNTKLNESIPVKPDSKTHSPDSLTYSDDDDIDDTSAVNETSPKKKKKKTDSFSESELAGSNSSKKKSKAKQSEQGDSPVITDGKTKHKSKSKKKSKNNTPQASDAHSEQLSSTLKSEKTTPKAGEESTTDLVNETRPTSSFGKKYEQQSEVTGSDSPTATLPQESLYSVEAASRITADKKDVTNTNGEITANSESPSFKNTKNKNDSPKQSDSSKSSSVSEHTTTRVGMSRSNNSSPQKDQNSAPTSSHNTPRQFESFQQPPRAVGDRFKQTDTKQSEMIDAMTRIKALEGLLEEATTEKNQYREELTRVRKTMLPQRPQSAPQGARKTDPTSALVRRSDIKDSEPNTVLVLKSKLGVVPSKRERHGSVVMGPNFFIWGGRGAAKSADLDPALYAFNVKSAQWKKVSCSGAKPYFGRHSHTCTLYAGDLPWRESTSDDCPGTMVSVGGISHQLQANDYPEYSPRSMIRKEPQLSLNRNSTPMTFSKDLLFIDLETKRWTRISPDTLVDPSLWLPDRTPSREVTAVKNHTTVIYKHRLYIYGGVRESGSSSHIDCINLRRMKWVPVPRPDNNTFKPRAVQAHSSVVWNGCMWVYGGRNNDGDLVADVFAYNFSTGAWSQKPIGGDIPSARCSHACQVVSNFMIVHGGNTAPLEYSKECYILNLSSLIWSRIQLVSPPNYFGVQCHSMNVMIDTEVDHPHNMSTEGDVMRVLRGFVFGGGGDIENVAYSLNQYQCNNDVTILDFCGGWRNANMCAPSSPSRPASGSAMEAVFESHSQTAASRPLSVQLPMRYARSEPWRLEYGFDPVAPTRTSLDKKKMTQEEVCFIFNYLIWVFLTFY